MITAVIFLVAAAPPPACDYACREVNYFYDLPKK
jgi:hypothetical protein